MSNRDPWFKFYPSKWLKDTRELSLEQRGAYIDAICIQMERGGPIPDDMSWLAHQLHVSSRKARSIVEQLIEAQMFRRSDAGLTNSKCEEVLSERESQRKSISEAASAREQNKRDGFVKQGRKTRETSVKLPRNSRETLLNQRPISDEKSKISNDFNETETRIEHGDASTRARSRYKKEDIRYLEGLNRPSKGIGSESSPPERVADARADEGARDALALGTEIKRGKIKLTKAEASRQTEECSGVEYIGGRVSVFNGAAVSLLRDFPGIDIDAVCNRSAPDIAKLRNPTPDQMLAIVRRHAQFACDDARKFANRQSAFAGRPKNLLAGLSLEQRAIAEAALAGKRGAN